jgi:hypothetical protein
MAGLLLLGGGTLAAIALRPRAAPVGPLVPYPAAPPPAPVPVAPPATSVAPVPEADSTVVAPMPRPAFKRPAPATPGRAAATGTVSIDCTPWCVPFVDGQPAGQDGRRFTLTLPAGTHQVEVRRLDDRQRRQVDVRPAERGALTFTFD